MIDLSLDTYCIFQYKINYAMGKLIPHVRKYNVKGELGAESWIDYYNAGDGKVYELKLSEVKKIPASKGKSIDISKSFILENLMNILDPYQPIFRDGPIVIYDLPCGMIKFEIIKKMGVKPNEIDFL